MTRKTLQWINTPVLSEAIFRYEKGLLPNSMKLWLEQVLEINSNKDQANKTLIAAMAAP